MKKSITTALITALLLTSMISCKKEPNDHVIPEFSDTQEIVDTPRVPLYHECDDSCPEIIVQEGVIVCASMDALDLSASELSDISALSQLTELGLLKLGYNQITDLSPLAGLTKLNTLILDNNQIVDLSPLSGLTELRFLSLDNNEIQDLSPLSGLTELGKLLLNQNNITDLSPLKSIPQLYWVMLNNNRIEDISPLLELKDFGRFIFIDEMTGDELEIPDGSYGDYTAELGLSGNPLTQEQIDELIAKFPGSAVHFFGGPES
jgi:Leucine-rich repeat (LRR) protein